MGITFSIIAAILAAVSNLLLRMSIGAGGTSKGHLAVQLFISCFVMILLNPIRMQNFHCHLPTLLFGGIGGLVLGLFFWGFGKTLEKGPANLSIAVLNMTALVPPIFMALLFGVGYGHSFTLFHGIGFFLVLIGVLWAGWSLDGMASKRLWVAFATFMFVCHSLFLLFLQWWAMLLNPSLPLAKLLPLHIASDDIQWFMPAIFFVAWLCQLVIFLVNERRWPSAKETLYGSIGGLINGGCAFFLILAPQVAHPWENALIFPIFSVGIILFCNVWAQGIYSEKINWKACILCVIGLVIGTLALR